MIDSPAARERWAQIVARMCAAYGRTNDRATITGVYWDSLRDVELEDAARAVAAAIANDTQWPTVARIRQLAGLGAPSSERLALDAWRAVRAAMSAHGRYRSIDFGPTVNAAVEALGGWVALCERTDDDLEAFVRPQFMRAVGAMAAPPADAPRYLRGITEQQNARTGYRLELEVVRVAVPGLPAPGSAPEIEDRTPQVVRRLVGEVASGVRGPA